MADKVDVAYIEELREAACQARLSCLDMALHADKEGAHLGGAFSSIEIVVALYRHVMRFDIDDLSAEARDRFIFSKGHGAPALYAVLAQLGIIDKEELNTFKDPDSFLSGHPSICIERGIDFSTGSLGQGLSLAVGSMLGMRRKGNETSRVFVLLGDGECDEGSVWEAAMAAAHYKLCNVIAVVDANGLQYDGSTDAVLNLGSLSEKWCAFGWDVYEIDGHDFEEILAAFDAIDARVGIDKPAVIVARTVKGKGVSFMENNRSWHHGRLTKALHDQAVEEVEARR